MPEYRLAWWWGPDGGLTGGPLPGGIVRLAVDYGGLAAFECGILPGGGRTVLLADHAVPVPAGGGMELRAPGLWTEMVVEEPGEYLSVGLEAFSVAVDDPDDAWRGGRTNRPRGGHSSSVRDRWGSSWPGTASRGSPWARPSA